MLIDDDAKRRARGVAAPARRPDLAASLLPILHKNVHVRLALVPALSLLCDVAPTRWRRANEEGGRPITNGMHGDRAQMALS